MRFANYWSRLREKVVTELGMFDITPEGFKLVEIAPDVTVEEVKAKTLGRLVIADNLQTMVI